MIITDITRESKLADNLQALQSYDDKERSQSCVHLSQIYRSIEQTALKKEVSDFTPEELKFFAAGGFLWERVFSMAMADAFRQGDIIRPGEFAADGIVGSPDNWDLRTGSVVETKCTWRSARKLEHIEKFFWTWLVQMQGYCKLLGTQSADLYVFFTNGNYAPPVPVFEARRIVWSKQEIDENWGMIVRHAKNKGWL